MTLRGFLQLTLDLFADSPAPVVLQEKQPVVQVFTAQPAIEIIVIL
jgi:hypothetical protein